MPSQHKESSQALGLPQRREGNHQHEECCGLILGWVAPSARTIHLQLQYLSATLVARIMCLQVEV